MTKFRNPKTTNSVEKKEGKKENNFKNSGHNVPSTTQKDSARILVGPIFLQPDTPSHTCQTFQLTQSAVYSQGIAHHRTE
jgi:hypothetical protein